MTLRCLLVDDEPLAHRIVQRYARDVPAVQIVGTCLNAFEAMEALRENEVDVLLLDMDMPRLSGMAFLRTLRHPPLVIVMTAHQEYALEGYEMDVVDFLTKPFSFERFLSAIQKAQHRLASPERAAAPQETGYIFVKVERRSVRLDLETLRYAEAEGDYVRFHTDGTDLLSYSSLKQLERQLDPTRFPRIHKSYLVALGKVTAVEGSSVEIDGRFLPLGKSYRSAFMGLVRGSG